MWQEWKRAKVQAEKRAKFDFLFVITRIFNISRKRYASLRLCVVSERVWVQQQLRHNVNLVSIYAVVVDAISKERKSVERRSGK